MFLSRTIENILENIEGDTEIIAVCDGNWPDPTVEDHPRVNLIYHSEPIGQRAATNEAARLSQAEFVMKADAHCAFDKGFDVKLMADCKYDWTVVPRMHNLHAFNWKCELCGNETYQGPEPKKCEKCGKCCIDTMFERKIIWQRRENRKSDYMWFNKDLKFSYFDRSHLKEYGNDISALKHKYAHSRRDWAKGKITDQMCAIGACWMMHRKRYWELDGVDEAHGSWGQMGVEIAMKSWLSGGRQVVNKNTWFAHMFRTQGGDFGFPYPLRGKEVQNARKYSQKLWKGNLWPKAIRPLSWLIDHFSPLPGWDEELKKMDEVKKPQIKTKKRGLTRGLVYYTDNRCEERILGIVRRQLTKICKGYEIISVSQYPIDWGRNIVMPFIHSPLSMFKQMLRGLQESTADIVFFAENDVLYHSSHFDFTPTEEKTFYYDRNRWAVDTETGKTVFYRSNCVSLMVAFREVLLKHYTKKVEITEKDGFRGRLGFSPPKGLEGPDRVGIARSYMAEFPSVDIRHNNTMTRKRMEKSMFRNERSCKDWAESDGVVGWGKTKGRFDEFLREVERDKKE